MFFCLYCICHSILRRFFHIVKCNHVSIQNTKHIKTKNMDTLSIDVQERNTLIARHTVHSRLYYCVTCLKQPDDDNTVSSLVQRSRNFLTRSMRNVVGNTVYRTSGEDAENFWAEIQCSGHLEHLLFFSHEDGFLKSTCWKNNFSHISLSKWVKTFCTVFGNLLLL